MTWVSLGYALLRRTSKDSYSAVKSQTSSLATLNTQISEMLRRRRSGEEECTRSEQDAPSDLSTVSLIRDPLVGRHMLVGSCHTELDSLGGFPALHWDGSGTSGFI